MYTQTTQTRTDLALLRFPSSEACSCASVHVKKILSYRPFHKTLPRSSAFINWISVRFYGTGCTLRLFSFSQVHSSFSTIYLRVITKYSNFKSFPNISLLPSCSFYNVCIPSSSCYIVLHFFSIGISFSFWDMFSKYSIFASVTSLALVSSGKV